ncbi:MAG: methyltransferase domain-containing protein [Deltaproteobacteria bacterium]|nr:methyltransferase domain-containing protein [Deltaproteobacteria bacterium]
MIQELLKIMACPECSGELRLAVERGNLALIENGSLTCQICLAVFPIRDDIPFFKPQVSHAGVRNQQETYSTWWDDYHDEQSIVDEAHRPFFYNSLRIQAEEFEGKVILDGGCGNGRFSYVVSHYRPKLLISFDISSGLLHAKRTITARCPEARVAYVQGDLTRPPFKKSVFDIVFSWGVTHHTPDTAQTVSTLSSLVRPGGLMGVYVYEFHPLYGFNRQSLSLLAYLRSLFLIRPLRFFCSRLSARIVQMIFTPIYYLERFFDFGVVGCHGSAEDKWNRERYRRVVIDRFKTRYASEHQLEEVIGWFRQSGFNELRVGSQPKVSVSGVKIPDGSSLPLEIKLYTQGETDPTVAKYLENDRFRKTGS